MLPVLPAAPRNPLWGKLLAILTLAGLVAFFAWREGVITIPIPGHASVTEKPWFVGVWFKHKTVGDGFELPTLEFRQSEFGTSGRIINPGADHDVGLKLEKLELGEDELTFITNGAAGRIRYRFIATAPDCADLYTVTDTEHNLANYLGERGGSLTVHAAAKREKVLRDLNESPLPEKIARMSRKSITLPRPPATPVAASPKFGDAPVKGAPGKAR